MEVHEVEIVMSAVSETQYPTTGYPEIGLVGRSNVGKSSLTNVLINRKSLARTSSQPGKTRTLNFYEVEHQLYFVDVPGYGYAKVSKKEREKFGEMIEHYLTSRQQLRGVIQLVDSRHEPSADDISMHEWLRYYDIPVLVVGTKVDKIKPGVRNKAESQIRKSLNMDGDTEMVLFSAETKFGKEKVWDWIEQHIGGVE